jgi:two-component system phosphate regulon sensor histidine kinase PhoR
MASSRVFSLLSIAAAAAFTAAGLLTSEPVRSPWLALGFILLGVSLGAFISNTIPSRSRTRAHGFSSELLDSTINEMREGLVVIDTDMRIVASNLAAQRLFANVDSSIERRITEITRNPAIYDAFLDGVRGTERVGVKVETHDRERRIFDLRVVPLRASADRRVTGALGVFFDVTRLERLENVRQEFLSNVSHELRTPLTSIIALSETLEVGAIDDPENNRRFLSIILKNATRMHRLTIHPR